MPKSKGWSKDARSRAALARKIKGRLGQAAYDNFKRTGKVPPGLDAAPPKKRAPKSSAVLVAAIKSKSGAGKSARNNSEFLASIPKIMRPATTPKTTWGKSADPIKKC